MGLQHKSISTYPHFWVIITPLQHPVAMPTFFVLQKENQIVSAVVSDIFLDENLSKSDRRKCPSLSRSSTSWASPCFISQTSSQQLGHQRSHSTPPPSPLVCPAGTTHRHRGRRKAAASSSPVLRLRGGRRWAWSPSLSETRHLLRGAQGAAGVTKIGITMG